MCLFPKEQSTIRNHPRCESSGAISSGARQAREETPRRTGEGGAHQSGQGEFVVSIGFVGFCSNVPSTQQSRSKVDDPDHIAIKARAKEMQRLEAEEIRQREANETALQAIGNPKKRLKTGGGGGSGAGNSSVGGSGGSGLNSIGGGLGNNHSISSPGGSGGGGASGSGNLGGGGGSSSLFSSYSSKPVRTLRVFGAFRVLTISFF